MSQDPIFRTAQFLDMDPGLVALWLPRKVIPGRVWCIIVAGPTKPPRPRRLL